VYGCVVSEPCVERVEVLGVNVSAINMRDAVATIEAWIANRSSNYVCITGAHGVIESQTDVMPLVWVSRLLGHRRTSRVYGPDLMRALTAVSATKGYRQFYYGGNEGVAALLATTLARQHPGLVVCGTCTPPFRRLTLEEDVAVVETINASKPDIVWVGLSTPKQEYWMASHIGRVDAPVMIGVGAAFDFLTGLKRQAPPWMQRNGLEWLFRLMSEPRRLWRRYASIVPRFIALAAAQLIRTKLQAR
jgi:N-acetylglucosaminyldiphosphoundecaprenol N-acetyl-beta-D-mannosaminyltransferase